MDALVACPDYSEVDVYWDSTRRRRITRLNSERGRVKWVYRKSSSPVPYACATDYRHHMDMQALPLNTVPQQIVDAGRWEINKDTSQLNALLDTAGTAACDINDPQFGYWCHLLFDITPVFREVSGEELPCLGTKLETLTKGLYHDENDSIVTNCLPERPARADHRDRMDERKEVLSLLEWAVIYREKFDPAREVLLAIPAKLIRTRQGSSLSTRYRICTIE